LVRTIINARKSFLKLNMIVGYFKGEMIYQLANNIYAEFFIGIGDDQHEIFFAKSKITELEPQNASVFWGNSLKLLPNIPDKSIDSFILNIPTSSELDILTNKASFSSMIKTIREKMNDTGSLQIITDIPRESELFSSIYDEVLSDELIDCSKDSASHLTKLNLGSLPYLSSPYVLTFCRKLDQ